MPVELSFAAVRVRTYAPLDSGAQGVLVDETFAKRLSLPLLALPSPRSVILADGSPALSAITSVTSPVALTVGRHSEVFSLDVCALSYPLFLGIPWLIRHNPVVDWRERCLVFSSGYCERHCRADGLEIVNGIPPPEVPLPPGELASLSLCVSSSPSLLVTADSRDVPKEYSAYLDVFSVPLSE